MNTHSTSVEATACTLIDKDLLRQWPLPVPNEQSDKNKCGSVLIIDGSAETPGALLLAALAALRSGVGRLRLATSHAIDHHPGPGVEARIAVLECRLASDNETIVR